MHVTDYEFMSTFCEIAFRWMPQKNFNDNSSGSGESLMLSDSKPLTEPILIQIYIAIWHHWTTMS